MSVAAPPQTSPGRAARPVGADVPPPGATGERMSAQAFLATSFPDDRPRELVSGWVVVADAWMAGRPAFPETPPMPPPGVRHGRHCFKAAMRIETFAAGRGLGQVFTNDSAVTTAEAAGEDGEDSLRGADVMYYSADTLPLGADLPDGPLPDPPEVVLEVRSPTDRPGQFRRKAREFLEAGVKVVVWLDPRRRTLTVCDDPAADDLGERVLTAGETFAPGPVVPGFSCTVSELLGT